VSAFSSYFVGVFLLSKFTFEQIENAFEDIHIVYNRENCISELFVLAREDILSNKVHEEVGDT